MSPQVALWCSRCGSGELHARSMCLPCYDSWRLSVRRFNGLRDSVLERDARRCVICLSNSQPVVHHRRKRARLPDLLTLCPRCHAIVHRTLYPAWHMDALLRTLWREQHPERPEQLPLLNAPAAAEIEALQLPLL